MARCKYLPLKSPCVHCGKPLKARRDYSVTTTLMGLMPLIYRHQDNTTYCYIKASAKPFSRWDTSREFEDEQRRVWAGIPERDDNDD